ncbi:Unknown protein [Striga hermonthica]|uniref:Uncharacterized protein n=1 Tax=Striga hermonthica TaxID=68872 RepID=A0A9N7RK86_STRHE|nr:Unknown protein [Striga hermonthica]
MAGGNPPKPPPSSSSAHTHHRNSGWGSSADKPSATTKSKPSPTSATATTPNNKDTKNNPPHAQPRPRPENPSPRPENPNAVHGPRPVFPINDPLPAPSYGFHMLDRRSIVLADGSARSYFALPPDYENHALAHMHRPGLLPDFMGRREFGLERPPLPMSPGFVGPDARVRNPEYWASGTGNPLKRKFGEDERGGRDDGYERVRQQLLQYGNANGAGPSTGYNLGRGEEIRASKNMRVLDGSSTKLKHGEVDQNALKKAFLHFVKLVFESGNQRKNYLADGKQGPVPCLACGRSDNSIPTLSLLMFVAQPLASQMILQPHGTRTPSTPQVAPRKKRAERRTMARRTIGPHLGFPRRRGRRHVRNYLLPAATRELGADLGFRLLAMVVDLPTG